MKYYNLATCVLILYDHALTFDSEVEMVWTGRWTLPKFLWIVVRAISSHRMVATLEPS